MFAKLLGNTPLTRFQAYSTYMQPKPVQTMGQVKRAVHQMKNGVGGVYGAEKYGLKHNLPNMVPRSGYSTPAVGGGRRHFPSAEASYGYQSDYLRAQQRYDSMQSLSSKTAPPSASDGDWGSLLNNVSPMARNQGTSTDIMGGTGVAALRPNAGDATGAMSPSQIIGTRQFGHRKAG